MEKQIDIMVAALKAAGAVELASASRKYRKFTYPLSNVANKYVWLGKSGAIRIGMTSTHSISMTDHKDSILLALAKIAASRSVMVAGRPQGEIADDYKAAEEDGKE
jgi:hypothetical protein